MKKVFLLIIVHILYISVCHAENLDSIQKDDVVILYDDGLENAAAAAARIYPVVKKGLEKALGWEVDFYPAIYLVKEHEHFQRMSGHPLVVGYAVPEKLLIVIDYSKMLTTPSSVSSIMKHELCHLLLHKNISAENLPKWFDEGVSQWVSGGLADIVMADYSYFDSVIITGRQIPFRYLSERFPADNEALMIAYAQSKSIVEYIAGEFNPDGICRLLNSLRSGKDMEIAVYESFLISFDELEENWYSAMRKKATWLTLFINNFYEFIFFFGALSLVAAYVKTVIRKRAMRDDEDDDSDLRQYP